GRDARAQALVVGVRETRQHAGAALDPHLMPAPHQVARRGRDQRHATFERLGFLRYSDAHASAPVPDGRCRQEKTRIVRARSGTARPGTAPRMLRFAGGAARALCCRRAAAKLWARQAALMNCEYTCHFLRPGTSA